MVTAKDIATKAVAEAETNAVRAQAAAKAATAVKEGAQLSAEDAMKFHVWWLQPVRENTMILLILLALTALSHFLQHLFFTWLTKEENLFLTDIFNYRFKQ